MDKLTDAELVERVAREVLGCNVTGDWGTSGKIICKTPPIGIQFDPFRDANDWLMALEEFEEWQITYSSTISEDRHKIYWCTIWEDGIPIATGHNTDRVRAVLEAALEAKGEKG